MTFHPRAGLQLPAGLARVRDSISRRAPRTARRSTARAPWSFVTFYLTAENVWKQRGGSSLPGTGPPRIPTRNKCTNMMGRDYTSSRQRQLHPHPIEGSMFAPAPIPTTPSRLGYDWRKDASIPPRTVIGGSLFGPPPSGTVIGDSLAYPPRLGGADQWRHCLPPSAGVSSGVSSGVTLQVYDPGVPPRWGIHSNAPAADLGAVLWVLPADSRYPGVSKECRVPVLGEEGTKLGNFFQNICTLLVTRPFLPGKSEFPGAAATCIWEKTTLMILIHVP